MPTLKELITDFWTVVTDFWTVATDFCTVLQIFALFWVIFGINCTRINQSQPRNICLYIIKHVTFYMAWLINIFGVNLHVQCTLYMYRVDFTHVTITGIIMCHFSSTNLVLHQSCSAYTWLTESSRHENYGNM